MQISTPSTARTFLRKSAGVSAAVAIAALLSHGSAAQAADLGAKDEPIKLGMVEWTGAQIIKDNDLPLASVPAGSEGALVSELEGATAAKKPLVMMFWAPHYALAEADIGWIKMPPCKVNDNAHCINPPDVDKIAWSGFGKKWPAAYEFLKHFEVHAKEQQQMILQVDKKGEDLDKVTKNWIDHHESVWEPWVKT